MNWTVLDSFYAKCLLCMWWWSRCKFLNQGSVLDWSRIVVWIVRGTGICDCNQGGVEVVLFLVLSGKGRRKEDREKE